MRYLSEHLNGEQCNTPMHECRKTSSLWGYKHSVKNNKILDAISKLKSLFQKEIFQRKCTTVQKGASDPNPSSRDVGSIIKVGGT